MSSASPEKLKKDNNDYPDNHLLLILLPLCSCLTPHTPLLRIGRRHLLINIGIVSGEVVRNPGEVAYDNNDDNDDNDDNNDGSKVYSTLPPDNYLPLIIIPPGSRLTPLTPLLQRGRIG